ncbi:magnesium transporter [bacterium]|nr:magnesium transporter [bacterium]
MSAIEINKDFIEELIGLLDVHHADELVPILDKLYAQDIAEIFDDLDLDQAIYLTSLLEPQKKVNVIIELEPDVRGRFFKGYSSDQIAADFFTYMDSDDAADVLNALSTDQSKEILRKIEDKEHSKNIASLLKFPENTAGALMAKELIKVKLNWTVKQCTDEIRKQAEDVSKVYTAYVVNDYDELVGWIGLKRILLSSERMNIEEIYNDNVIYENTYASGEEVASTMRKYDLVALPIVDAFGRLVGRITFDDVMDYIKDEAEKDYQMLSGLSSGVGSGDSIWLLSKARLPWLIIGLFGGIGSSLVIGGFEEELQNNVQLALFMPLIMAMGGNVGVQSSSIMVQGLANNTLDSSGIFGKLGKEFMVGLLNGLVCSLLLLAYGYVFGNSQKIMITVSIALITIILLAAIVGTVIPLLLDKLKIDPALATGPFITTSNDLLGLFLYFLIGNIILGTV